MMCTTVLHGGVCHRTSTPHKSGIKMKEKKDDINFDERVEWTKNLVGWRDLLIFAPRGIPFSLSSSYMQTKHKNTHFVRFSRNFIE